MRGAAKFLPLAALLLVCGYLLYQWRVEANKPDVEKIRDSVQRIVDSAVARRPGGIVAELSEHYADSLHTSRDALERQLQQGWFMFKRVAVTVTSGPDVAIDPESPDAATATFSATVLLGTDPEAEPTSQLVQQARGSDRFVLHYKNEDGVWRVVKSETGGRNGDR